MLSTYGTLLGTSRYFFFRRIAPQYFADSSATFADPLAQQLATTPDKEYQRLKLLCFFCVMSTWGSILYGISFPEHVKRFKDEPWA
jgi:hypothetical protein